MTEPLTSDAQALCLTRTLCQGILSNSREYFTFINGMMYVTDKFPHLFPLDAWIGFYEMFIGYGDGFECVACRDSRSARWVYDFARAWLQSKPLPRYMEQHEACGCKLFSSRARNGMRPKRWKGVTPIHDVQHKPDCGCVRTSRNAKQLALRAEAACFLYDVLSQFLADGRLLPLVSAVFHACDAATRFTGLLPPAVTDMLRRCNFAERNKLCHWCNNAKYEAWFTAFARAYVSGHDLPDASDTKLHATCADEARDAFNTVHRASSVYVAAAKSFVAGARAGAGAGAP